MSDCRFQYDFNGSSAAIVDQLRAKIGGAGGTFDGSDTGGTFSLKTPVGTFGGDYTIQGQTIWVEVTNKPAFVPCSAIESKLSELVKRYR